MMDLQTYESPLAVAAIEPFILRFPLPAAVHTPMAVVDSAVALLLQVRLKTGEVGWGEVWCNFPQYGAFHRAAILKHTLEPFLAAREFAGPHQAWMAMTRAVNLLRLQGGETGPFAAAIAGVDIALWDIAGRRAGLPLWRLLGGDHGTIRTYASLGRAHGYEPLVEQGLARGFRGFKLRAWGDPSDCIEAFRGARRMIGPDMELMADANSSWPIDRAAEWAGRFADVGLSFLEEPIPVDSPLAEWQALARHSPARLAGGENMLSEASFDDAIASGAYGVLQPDICKWGGFSGVLPLARRIVASGLRYCPHIFSGAPGLLASAHVLAASNSPDGALEYGVEFKPQRDDFVRHVVRDGCIEIGDAPGLGVEIDPVLLARYRVAMTG